MEKIRKNVDTLIDIIIITMLMTTALIVVTSPAIKFLLITVGCGAIFNNCKYLFDINFKKRKNK